jgi:hypothetical protein
MGDAAITMAADPSCADQNLQPFSRHRLVDDVLVA